jgi:predicted PurR-regulated permease PerM
MGIVGLFVGPVLMALLVAVWREWVHHEEVERDTARLRASASTDNTPAGG